MKKLFIIVPFHNPWNWHTDYANQTATLLSKYYAVICYLWGDARSFREIIVDAQYFTPLTKLGNLWLYHPLYLIPGKRILCIQYVNMFLNLIAVYIISAYLAALEGRKIVMWFFGIFDPVFMLIPIWFRWIRTVYDCVDIPSHPDTELNSELNHMESDILSYAWIVTANSHTMHARLMAKRPDTHLVPLGFRNEMFDRRKQMIRSTHSAQPIIGYIGAIDYRIDIGLLEYLIARHKTWRFILAGPVFSDHLTPRQYARLRAVLSQDTVRHTVVSHAHIPTILSQCDVTIIPYTQTNTFNTYSFPMKTMEYFYAQKRIISTSIRELRAYTPIVLFARSRSDWDKALRYALHHPLGTRDQKRAKKIAESQTWNKKIDALMNIMETTA